MLLMLMSFIDVPTLSSETDCPFLYGRINKAVCQGLVRDAH